jgi:hypothetical protein
MRSAAAEGMAGLVVGGVTVNLASCIIGLLQPLRYRRFATAAEAIRFAVEKLPAVRALGAWMQVGDERFDGDDIQRLYESDDFPLQRRLSE